METVFLSLAIGSRKLSLILFNSHNSFTIALQTLCTATRIIVEQEIIVQQYVIYVE